MICALVSFCFMKKNQIFMRQPDEHIFCLEIKEDVSHVQYNCSQILSFSGKVRQE